LDSAAYGINDNKQVVGYFTIDPDCCTRPFIWDGVNGMRNLGTLPGGEWGTAYAINNRNQVVGIAGTGPDNDPAAFIWDSKDGIKNLNDLIPAGSGWNLVYATSINDKGQIVGWGFHNGEERNFVLTAPPEPLIFIPGNPGSYLVDQSNNSERWPGVGTFHDSLTLDPSASPNPNIIATDAISAVEKFGVTWKVVYGPLLNMLTTTGGYQKYEVNNDPNRRTTAGCDLSQKSDDPVSNPDLFVFAYDWRKSNIENADKLRDYIGCVQQFYPNTKVDILAHSNGGLVARRYILDNPGKVNRLITIGTPWLGVPKAINALETGDSGFDWRLIWSSTLKSLVEFFPSAHQALPSEDYYYLGGRPFAERGDFNQNGIPDEEYSYAQQTDLLNQRYPWAGSTPGTTNVIFHNYPGQDDWRNDTSGVEYHDIVSQQHTNQTIGQVVAQRINLCYGVDVGFYCIDRELFDTKMINGDGTVPIRSALRLGYVDGHEVSLAPASHYWKYRAVNDAEDDQFEHTALTQLPHIHALVLFLLDRGPDPGSHDIARTTPKSNAVQQVAAVGRGRRLPVGNRRRELRAAHYRSDRVSKSLRAMSPASLQTPNDEIAPSYYVTVTGVDFVSVTDEAGNTNTQIDDTFAASVPNVSYNLIGEKAVMVSMPADKTFTIRFRVGNEPISLSILKGLDNVTPSEALRYRDVVLPSGATVDFRVGTNGVENVRYDADGDGIFEATITPTVSLVGAAAADTTAPTISVNGIPQQSGTLVTITAQDSETGVKAVYYSLDRTHYQRYTAPFTVSPAQTPMVYTFADDNAANRSGLMTYAIPREVFNFSGFFAPVSNLPAVNSVKGGQGIPVKFSLGGNRGLNIFAPVPNNPGSGAISCDATAQIVNLDQTVTAGNSSLTYDSLSDQYVYVWKTDSAWAGTCRQLVIQLNDGSIHRANFKFK
jgi:probable HAF family extracellular repeat protein